MQLHSGRRASAGGISRSNKAQEHLCTAARRACCQVAACDWWPCQVSWLGEESRQVCRPGSWRSSGVADQHVHGVLHCTQTITTGDCNKQLAVCPASWGCWQVLGSVPPPTRLHKCLGTEGHLGAAISKGTDKQAEVQAKLKSAVPLQAATCQAARAGIDWSCNPLCLQPQPGRAGLPGGAWAPLEERTAQPETSPPAIRTFAGLHGSSPISSLGGGPGLRGRPGQCPSPPPAAPGPLAEGPGLLMVDVVCQMMAS